VTPQLVSLGDAFARIINDLSANLQVPLSSVAKIRILRSLIDYPTNTATLVRSDSGVI
jgi:hypothetical protein